MSRLYVHVGALQLEPHCCCSQRRRLVLAGGRPTRLGCGMSDLLQAPTDAHKLVKVCQNFIPVALC